MARGANLQVTDSCYDYDPLGDDDELCSRLNMIIDIDKHATRNLDQLRLQLRRMEVEIQVYVS
ncbi:MAG: hypothetical protein KIH01_06235 [Candidatus Freyarchaeota archaeon]|nr:hypothetical protein [Candidatus Jordarchaeia archaeon]